MLVVIAFMAGLLTGTILARIIFKPKLAGNLRVDRSESDEPPYFFFECTDASKLSDKYITLEVIEKNYVPQE